MTSVVEAIKTLTLVSREIADYVLPLTDEMKRVRVGVHKLRRELENIKSTPLKLKFFRQYDRLLDDFEEEKELLFIFSTGQVSRKNTITVAEGIKTLAIVSREIADHVSVLPLTDEMQRVRVGVENLRRKLQSMEWSTLELEEMLWPQYDRLLDDFEDEKELLFTLSTGPEVQQATNQATKEPVASPREKEENVFQ